MNTNQFKKIVAGIALVAFLMSIVLQVSNSPAVVAAPLGAVAPVSYSGIGGDNLKLTFFNGAITADTRVCFDLSSYKSLDLQYIIDQGTTNTTTIKYQWSNQGTATTDTFEDEATVVSANAADAHGGIQYRTYGTFDCIYADVTNANPLGLKVFAVAKK